MIKYLANEPSVGLYFVQQHAKKSMPNLLDVKEKVTEKIHDVSLNAEDVEDSINVLRSMTEFGYPLAKEMIKDIQTSLVVISKCQPKRGLIPTATWGPIHQTDVGSSNAAAVTFGSTNNSDPQDRSYFSTVLSSAKQRAAGFRRPLINQPLKVDQVVQSPPQSLFAKDFDAEELPLSSSLQTVNTVIESRNNPGRQDQKIFYPLQAYSKFNNDKEANYEAWIQESDEQYKFFKPCD